MSVRTFLFDLKDVQELQPEPLLSRCLNTNNPNPVSITKLGNENLTHPALSLTTFPSLYTLSLLSLLYTTHTAALLCSITRPAPAVVGAMAEIYYELSWAILSTIGLLLTLLGVLVICITNLTRLTMVPVVTSAACAVANGLCYCAFYSERPIPQQIAAAVVADVMWMVAFFLSLSLSLVVNNCVPILRLLTDLIDTRCRVVILQLLPLKRLVEAHFPESISDCVLDPDGMHTCHAAFHHGHSSENHQNIQ